MVGGGEVTQKCQRLLVCFGKLLEDEEFCRRASAATKSKESSGGGILSSIPPLVVNQGQADYALLKKYLKANCDLSATRETNQSADVRVYADGIFDLIHSGHFNALRQAGTLGTRLVVGVVSDEEATRVKGIPIYTQRERAELIGACKWVDEVVEGTPYAVTLEQLKSVRCDVVAHGDDFAPCEDGSDCYAEPRKAGKLRVFKRTEGISTTTLVSRLLLATTEFDPPLDTSIDCPTSVESWIQGCLRNSPSSKQTLMSSKRLLQFCNENPHPKPTDKIVYVDGSFDVFHVGHLRTLQKAKELGDFLLVGIHDDATVRALKGPGFPVMNLLERALNVLAMRVVDEVIIGAPWQLNEYLIKSFKIDVVVRGTLVDSLDPVTPNPRFKDDPYEVPKALGMYHEVPSESSLTTRQIIQRIVDNRISLLSSIQTRGIKEECHYARQVEKGATIVEEV